MIAIVLSTFAVALAAPILYRFLRSGTGWVLAALPVTQLIYFARFAPFEAGESHRAAFSWVPGLGVELSFLLDGLSATFVFLICLIGALVLVYAGGYLVKDPRCGRLYAFLLLFMGSMLGLVLSDNLISLFVFWELTGVSSFLLIGFNHEERAARDGALTALLVTGAGGLALLAGILLMAFAAADLGVPAAEALRLSALSAVDLRSHPLYLAVLILVLVGAFTKSAQVPWHFWLPGAMVAPTPVSAYLHSATMVKAGIYLLARLHPVLGYTLPWEIMVITCGASTMLAGALMATGQHDLKRILAYSTVSVLGAVTMLLGVGTELAIKAAVVFLVAHALYKAALFMVAGNIDHETGTRDVTALGGLRRLMPVTAAAGVLAALSKAGAPPMFGFVGKELLYKAKLDIESIGSVLITVAVIANILLVAMALVVATWPFFGERRSTPKTPHEAPASMLVGPLLLAVIGLFVGMIPSAFDRNLGSAIATAIAGKPIEMRLTLWHGLSAEALAVGGLSAVTLAAGFALYRRLRVLLVHTAEGVRQVGRFGPARLYEWSLSNLYPSAERLSRTIQSGYLRRYLLLVVVSTIAMVSVPLLRAVGPDLRADRWDPRIHEAVTAILILGGAWATVRARAWLAGVAALGAVGLGVTLVFAAFGAPDLAITQIMVEVLTVILLVLVFYHLPAAVRRSRRLARARDGTIALAAGAMMALVVLASDAIHLDPAVSRYFAEQSLPAAYGRNVVNVILVDFRSLDTLGEITVVAVAAVGICALLRPHRRRNSPGENSDDGGGIR